MLDCSSAVVVLIYICIYIAVVDYENRTVFRSFRWPLMVSRRRNEMVFYLYLVASSQFLMVHLCPWIVVAFGNWLCTPLGCTGTGYLVWKFGSAACESPRGSSYFILRIFTVLHTSSHQVPGLVINFGQLGARRTYLFVSLDSQDFQSTHSSH